MSDFQPVTFEIRVTCYAGYRGEEEPRRLWFDDRAVEIAEILDRWLAPDHRYFKVLGDDGDTYIIRHDCAGDFWELTLFERAHCAHVTVAPTGKGPRTIN